MKVFGILFIFLFVVAGGFFLFQESKTWEIRPVGDIAPEKTFGLKGAPEALKPEVSSTLALNSVKNLNGDIEIQRPLSQPPLSVKAIYVTGWSAGSTKKIDSLIKLIDETELNAIVVDVKDYSGFLSYKFDYDLARESGAFNELRIIKPNILIKKLHDKGIYVIGRISVFQDPILAEAQPDWAIKSSSTKKVWKDRKGLAWMDPASREVWAYNLKIAEDALSRGFDEINFDYIRFPSDGDLNDLSYFTWNEKTSMADVIEGFFKYMRGNLKDAKISADLFGLVTIEKSDLGIGQVLEKAFPYFDYIAPMIYPSHFGPGVMGFKNPAIHPYEVIKNSLISAINKLKISTVKLATTTSTPIDPSLIALPEWPKFRPWLQDFDLGADYDATMVREQIRAVEELGISGWMLWDPKNVYTRGALKTE